MYDIKKNDDASEKQLEEYAKQVQEYIEEEVRKKYSRLVVEHWQNPRNWGIMNDADAYARITGPCGDTMELSLKIKDKMITRCTFDTDGCGATVSCGSIVTVMVKGMSIIKARQVSQEAILTYCGGLPEENQHCALLVANTLQKAIDDYSDGEMEPWKKYYKTTQEN